MGEDVLVLEASEVEARALRQEAEARLGKVELASLDQLERVRHGGGPGEDVGDLMQAFSGILRAPPEVELLRVDETPAS